ncbi:hypothetical protein LINPERHAP1_LOCUS28393 [Linum perenne]
MCWNIWKARNDAVFNNIAPCPTRTLDLFTKDCSLRSSPTLGLSPHLRSPASTGPPLDPPHPEPPPLPSTSLLQVYCDGSFQRDPQKAAYGVVMMNTAGDAQDGRAGRFICSTPIVAEARALLEAVSLASSYRGPCMVFSDCLILVNCLKTSPNRWPWECFRLLDCVSKILTDFPMISVRFCNRRFNRTADWIARSARD